MPRGVYKRVPYKRIKKDSLRIFLQWCWDNKDVYHNVKHCYMQILHDIPSSIPKPSSQTAYNNVESLYAGTNPNWYVKDNVVINKYT